MRAFVIPDTKSATLIPLVESHIEKGSTVSSDLWRSYRGLKTDYLHGTVNHSQKEYVNEEHHTQAIEGFWSHLKRSISGTHVWVSKKHLQKYIGEFIFRYNLRKDPTSMFDWMLWNLSRPEQEVR